ncbi:MAG: hypothetical protein A2758_02375 [Candidatus Zambryskibacteria bacterium RIFCSPHIGHO2_01_FULL_49_18]|uniref:Transglutaminase-like domain-containing protein n=2 Tax=Candidatus Zambryskiibacteriota TaxID=1817925 RepID=A0A1G2T1W8_9BACT|nr:MAG: hypothetical protein A2758_02375 [Candidatus Zambryskibacteria bacterium RIFCSPHIGHO2_01_FULL_49_18]OHB06168.1 MAG: hypothetical protein A3A26_01335 [Candidatus Zambryskibacteria bacterium RIFCSPLOWO2_01_FULL_47_14]
MILSKLKNLSTPVKVQDFLNKLPFNFEKHGETHNSVEVSLKRNKAHCFEGALIAAAALALQGRRPLLLDLVTVRPDFDHVVALFKEGRYWGAISKTNHAVLRYRDPIYKSVRELAMSYFHEYFINNGRKTLRKYSKPFDLTHLTQPSPSSRRGQEKSMLFSNPGEVVWINSKENLAWLAHKLDKSPHFDILTPSQIKHLRKADRIEVKASELKEWKSR